MGEDLTIEEILLQDPLFRSHFVRKHLPKYLSLPEVDYSLFSDQVKAEALIKVLKIYLLEYPLLEDDFGIGLDAHKARRHWRGELSDKYDGNDIGGVWKYFTRNKLKGSVIGNVASCLRSLVDYCIPQNTAFIQKINKTIEEIESLFDDYLNIPLQDKINYVRQIEDKVYSLFECIAVKKNPP